MLRHEVKLNDNEGTKASLDEFIGLLGLLSTSAPPETIVRALVQGFLDPFEVQRASLHLLSRCGHFVRMVGDYGYPTGSTDRFTAIDVSIDLPVTEVLRRSSVLVLAPEDLPDRYPALRSNDAQSDVSDLGTTDQQWVFLPIQMRGRSAAALALLGKRSALREQRNLLSLQGVSFALSLWLHRAWDTPAHLAGNEGSEGVYPLTFSERQVRILHLVGEGLTNTQIADRLHCSPSTVKQELHRAMRSLDADDRAVAAQRAREFHLLDSPPPLEPPETAPHEDSS